MPYLRNNTYMKNADIELGIDSLQILRSFEDIQRMTAAIAIFSSRK
jgi:hypothetical protein